jgi:NADH-quinone oxidoreductase subunit J
MIEWAFHLLSGLAVFGAIMVVASRQPIYSILYLIITFFAVAGHFLLLSAQFLAVVQVIVYAGAIMVLFLFVVMLLNLKGDVEPRLPNLIKLGAVGAGGLMLLLLVAAVGKVHTAGVATSDAIATRTAEIGMVKNVGKVLFTEFLLPFEVVSILFLSAMVGAVLLGKKDPDKTTTPLSLGEGSGLPAGRAGVRPNQQS